MDPALTAVFSGNAHPKLAHDIARYLHMPVAHAQVGRFSDGEINVEILENIRGLPIWATLSLGLDQG